MLVDRSRWLQHGEWNYSPKPEEMFSLFCFFFPCEKILVFCIEGNLVTHLGFRIGGPGLSPCSERISSEKHSTQPQGGPWPVISQCLWGSPFCQLRGMRPQQTSALSHPGCRQMGLSFLSCSSQAVRGLPGAHPDLPAEATWRMRPPLLWMEREELRMGVGVA